MKRFATLPRIYPPLKGDAAQEAATESELKEPYGPYPWSAKDPTAQAENKPLVLFPLWR